VRRQQLFIFMLPLPILGSHKADRLALGIGPQQARPPGLPPKIFELTLHSEGPCRTRLGSSAAELGGGWNEQTCEVEIRHGKAAEIEARCYSYQRGSRR